MSADNSTLHSLFIGRMIRILAEEPLEPGLRPEEAQFKLLLELEKDAESQGVPEVMARPVTIR